MDLREYQEAAARTAHPRRDRFFRIAVAGLGLAGESAEVLKVATAPCGLDSRSDLLEEVGDTCWYVAEIATCFDIPLQDVPLRISPARTILHGSVQLSMQAGLLADYLKKYVAHGRPIEDEALRSDLALILGSAAAIAELAGSSLEGVCGQNVRKLEARYPDGPPVHGTSSSA